MASSSRLVLLATRPRAPLCPQLARLALRPLSSRSVSAAPTGLAAQTRLVTTGLQGPRVLSPSLALALGRVSSRPALALDLARRSLTTSAPSSYAATPAAPVTSPAAPLSSPPPHPSSSSSCSSESDTPPPPPPPEEPQPSSAYARFKLLSKKYGWYAAAMYFALSSVDFSLSFLLVHAIGLDGIEPAVRPLIHQFHRLRYGEVEAGRMDEEARREREVHAREVQEAAAAGAGSGEGAGKKALGVKSGYWGSKTFWAEVSLGYVIHKTLLLPVRAGLVVAWTPKVVNWMTKRGWVGKGGLGRAASHAQDRLRERTGRIKGGAGGSD